MAQKYIPGLTAKPAEQPVQSVKLAPKDVPPELIDEFHSGSKQVMKFLRVYILWPQFNVYRKYFNLH